MHYVQLNTGIIWAKDTPFFPNEKFDLMFKGQAYPVHPHSLHVKVTEEVTLKFQREDIACEWYKAPIEE